jgi:hypothetical protein
MYVFAFYLALLGATILLVPNVLLGLVGLPATTEVWVRVVGMLVGILALYYWVAARTEARGIMWASVLARFAVPACLTVFVVAGWVAWPIVCFGIVDGLAALWTWSALRSAG